MSTLFARDQIGTCYATLKINLLYFIGCHDEIERFPEL
jgi:hypothetical protein